MNQLNRPEVLIIAGDARAYAGQIDQLAGPAIPYLICETVADARSQYAGHEVLFGKPDMIAKVISDMPAVQWVQSSWAGVTPLLKVPRRDYSLTGIRGIFGSQMSEYVLGYLLAHELRIVKRDAEQCRGNWHDELSGTLRGKVAGIMGTGSIGSHIAGMLRHFSVRVTGLNRSGHAAENFDQVFALDQLQPFLEPLDYLVAVLPQTPHTDGLLDAAALAALPPHAVLINVGRANVINHHALATALQENRLAGAVLDVFDEEPLPESSPLWRIPRLKITAHIAAHSHPADITPVFVDNYQRFVTGQDLKHLIGFQRGY